MGKIVVCTMVSIDGYTEGRGGDVMALPLDEAFARHNEDRVRSASSFLLGATTYRGFLTYWPHQHDNPDASPLDRYIAEPVRRRHPAHRRLGLADRGRHGTVARPDHDRSAG